MDCEKETIFFTVINPNTDEETVEEERIEIEINPDGNGNFAINGLAIDHQQLAELGVLLFALACRAEMPNLDLDSCGELLDGFNIPVPTKELKELTHESGPTL